MPLLRNTAQALTESVRVSGTTDAPYVASTWPNDATARMWYSKDGGTPVAIIPTRVDATTGGWRLSTSILTAGVWDCDELRIFWEGTGIASGQSKYYTEALYTATVAGRIDEAISAAKTLTAGERTTLYTGIWNNATRTLTAISDSAGVTTLLTRLTSTRAAYLDALTALTEGRMVWLERLGTALEETSTGSGIWRLTTLALSRLGIDVSAIRAKTDALPASPATEASASAAATSAATAATQATSAATQATNAATSAASADSKLTTGRLTNLDAATPTRLGILDRLAGMMEQVTGLWRWTANTLSQAPAADLSEIPTNLVIGPLTLTIEGAGSDGVLEVRRGDILTVRAALKALSGQAINLTGATLTAKIVGLDETDLVTGLTVTALQADEGTVEVILNTTSSALATVRRARLVITRTVGSSDITSYPAQLLFGG